MQGDSIVGARIRDSDLGFVHRSISPKNGHIVLAVVNQDYTVKRLYKRAGVIELRPENPQYPSIRCSDDKTLEI